ncbi:MAG: DUF4443 domain-containing protein [Candidatus Nanohaloarchaea archaeon]|nr:DUF4443 domain-containing protein [Candidatus Nanohaloarchaea archaeon]
MLDDLDRLNVPRYYALAAIYHVGAEDIGRRRLADELGLTESKTRTMLDHLRDAGYIEVQETLTLAERGSDVREELAGTVKQVSPVSLDYLVDDAETLAVLLADTDIEDELSLRDEAVRGGATGMTVLTYDDGFRFPEREEPGSAAYREDRRRLDELFGAAAGDGDTLLAVFAGARPDAAAGMWRALLALLA